jgi:hypothetical protein
LNAPLMMMCRRSRSLRVIRDLMQERVHVAERTEFFMTSRGGGAGDIRRA